MSEKIDPKDPSQPSKAYREMIGKWKKIGTLLGGTDAMRAAGQAYLPKHPDEEESRYAERLATATLFNMTEMTLNSWVGRPFSDPVQLSEDMPEEVKTLLDNIDLMGNNIDVFARNWFKDGVAKGFSHVLVDFPRKKTEDEDGNPIQRTLEDDKREGLRPYWVHIKPENVIFAYAVMKDGREHLVQVRILEEVTSMEGFAEVCTTKIRVITAGLQEIYVPEELNNGKVEWILEDSFPYDLPFIPLVTYYADKDGFMLAKPPIIDLADLNIAHWQSTSDQRTILTVARFPMLALSGGEDDDGELTIGPHNWLFTKDPSGKFYYVEHSGKSIEAGRQDLMDLEEQMGNYGAEFLKKRPGSLTATARALDSAEATSPLQDMTVRFMDACNQALQFTAEWLRIDQAGEVIISTEFGPEDVDANDLRTLIETRKNGDISRKAYLTELVRRGLLDDDFDIDADAEVLEEEVTKKMALAIDEMAAMTEITNGGENEEDEEDKTEQPKGKPNNVKPTKGKQKGKATK